MEVNDSKQTGTSGVPPSIYGVPISPEHIQPFTRNHEINRIGSTRIVADNDNLRIRSATNFHHKKFNKLAKKYVHANNYVAY